MFTKNAPQALKDLNFKSKKAIVMNIIEKVVGIRELLQVSGYIPITSNINVITINRNCRITKRRKIHII